MYRTVFGLCGRGRGWDDLGEWHWNMYNIIYEMSRQSRFDALIPDAWGWCSGMTQRDGMGREEGGGLRMGNTCIPVVDSCWYMATPIQYCKLKKLKWNKNKNKEKLCYKKKWHEWKSDVGTGTNSAFYINNGHQWVIPAVSRCHNMCLCLKFYSIKHTGRCVSIEFNFIMILNR